MKRYVVAAFAAAVFCGCAPSAGYKMAKNNMVYYVPEGCYSHVLTNNNNLVCFDKEGVAFSNEITPASEEELVAQGIKKPKPVAPKQDVPVEAVAQADTSKLESGVSVQAVSENVSGAQGGETAATVAVAQANAQAEATPAAPEAAQAALPENQTSQATQTPQEVAQTTEVKVVSEAKNASYEKELAQELQKNGLMTGAGSLAGAGAAGGAVGVAKATEVAQMQDEVAQEPNLTKGKKGKKAKRLARAKAAKNAKYAKAKAGKNTKVTKIKVANNSVASSTRDASKAKKRVKGFRYENFYYEN